MSHATGTRNQVMKPLQIADNKKRDDHSVITCF